jgi:uncharacterized protein (DUF4415 family)
MSEESIVRYTLSNVPEGRADWKRLVEMTEEEIDAQAAADPDNPPWTDEELETAEVVTPEDRANKVAVYIRLDREVLDYYKAGGRGYQTRINRDLRRLVRSRRKPAPRRSTDAG